MKKVADIMILIGIGIIILWLLVGLAIDIGYICKGALTDEYFAFDDELSYHNAYVILWSFFAGGMLTMTGLLLRLTSGKESKDETRGNNQE